MPKIAEFKGPKPNLNNATPAQCLKCSSEAFISAMRLLEVSSVDPSNPTGHTIYVPIPIFICCMCKSEFGAADQSEQ